MKRFLLLLGAAGLLVAAPAFAQYVFLDTNNSSTCTSSDQLTSANTSVDVWFDTNHKADGTAATCATGEQLTINSYEFILSASGTGTVTYGLFTNLMAPGMGTDLGTAGTGGSTDYHTGFGGGTALAPGLYHVGTLAITVTGTPVLGVMASTTLNPSYLTAFGSQCLANAGDNTMKLGDDFLDACGTAAPTAAKTTTWGAIKNLYK